VLVKERVDNYTRPSGRAKKILQIGGKSTKVNMSVFTLTEISYKVSSSCSEHHEWLGIKRRP
jgi:hypothetical protein